MSLWIDKYRPKTIDDLDYNVEQLEVLKQIVAGNDFPHLLFCGPDGCGKRTRMRCLLREIYGDGIYQMKNAQIPFETTAGKPGKLNGLDSKFHVEVRPSDLGFQDRAFVQSLIKETASLSVDATIYKKPFRVVIIQEADLLTNDAQEALRRTMEKSAGSCKLFLCCTSLNKIIDPIVSRCMVIRLPAPTVDQMTSVIKKVAAKECVNVSDAFCLALSEESDRNVRRAILLLETAVSKDGKSKNYTDKKQIVLPDWKAQISKVVGIVLSEQTSDGIYKARAQLYELINHLIPTQIIFEALVAEFCKRVGDKAKCAVYEAASKYQHLSLFADKPIVYLEGFLLEFICLNMENK